MSSIYNLFSSALARDLHGSDQLVLLHHWGRERPLSSLNPGLPDTDSASRTSHKPAATWQIPNLHQYSLCTDFAFPSSNLPLAIPQHHAVNPAAFRKGFSAGSDTPAPLRNPVKALTQVRIPHWCFSWSTHTSQTWCLKPYSHVLLLPNLILHEESSNSFLGRKAQYLRPFCRMQWTADYFFPTSN